MRKKRKERRDKWIEVRVTEKERRAIHAYAEKADMSVSQMVRCLSNDGPLIISFHAKTP